MDVISEEVVRGTATICGPHSAAAQALAEAERCRARGDTVVFVRVRGAIRVYSIGEAASTTAEGKGASDE